MTRPVYISLPETGSTNTWLKEHADEIPVPAVAVTDHQTSGRGQRGNTWEAEPGKNLTFSMLFKPEGVAPSGQFFISEAVCLGIVDTLRRYLPHPETVKVKWPNDVYAGDRKICGILIEHSLESASAIRHTIAGIGLNVNQKEFHSSAPNPVSMFNLTGKVKPLRPLLEQLVEAISANLEAPKEAIHDRYLETLWRGNGQHLFATPSGERFRASITGIAPAGALTLRRADGSETSYLFKEVQFIL